MARKKSVNILFQTLLVIIPIPIVWLFASYRIEKLRLTILILALGAILSWVLGFVSENTAVTSNDFVYTNGDLRIHLIPFFYIAFFYTFFIYLIRQWSKNWNDNLSETINLKDNMSIKKNKQDFLISILLGFTITILLWSSFDFEQNTDNIQNTIPILQNTTQNENKSISDDKQTQLDPCLDPNLMYSSILKCR